MWVAEMMACRFVSRASKCLIYLILMLEVLLLPASASSATNRSSAKQDQPHALGSLSRVGDVYVNDALLSAAESTIFLGDKLRTGENGVASFTVSGRGTLKLSPNTFVVFAGADQYVADLRSGTIVVSSFSGPSGLAVRVGDYIVVPAVQDVQTSTKVERTVPGAANIACLEGSVSVISAQGAAGVLLQAGQSSAISASGELNPKAGEAAVAAEPPPAPEAPGLGQPQPGPAPPATTSNQRKSRKGWIILGLAAAGGVGIAAAAAGGGGSHQPVSPASP